MITWRISGQIHADDTSALVTRLIALRAAYSRWYSDLGLYDASGNLTHGLLNRGSTSGVKVVKPPHFPKGDGAQLSTFRDYEIVLEARYPATNQQNPLLAFNETLSFSGGGPRRTVVECTNVPPQEQLLTLYTAYRARQSGSATGLYGYPPIPAPIFPGALEVNGEPTFGSPRLKNGRYVNFPVTWNYSFVSAVPLVGLPNAWPAG